RDRQSTRLIIGKREALRGGGGSNVRSDVRTRSRRHRSGRNTGATERDLLRTVVRVVVNGDCTCPRSRGCWGERNGNRATSPRSHRAAARIGLGKVPGDG